jgi:hypothetical protein
MKHQEITNKNPMEPQKEEPGAHPGALSASFQSSVARRREDYGPMSFCCVGTATVLRMRLF